MKKFFFRIMWIIIMGWFAPTVPMEVDSHHDNEKIGQCEKWVQKRGIARDGGKLYMEKTPLN